MGLSAPAPDGRTTSGRAPRLVLVYLRGGAPLEFALPSMARVAELHVLALSPLPQHTRHLWEHCVASIRSAEDLGCSGPVDIIVDACRAVRADAVTTLSEFALLAVSGAATSASCDRPGGMRACRHLTSASCPASTSCAPAWTTSTYRFC